MAEIVPDRSYRALLRVPSIARVLLGMQIARIATAMVSVALVLFTLTTYRSPELAGLVTFASIFPGLLASPIAGALLDRYGRTWLVMLDYLVAFASLALIGILSQAGMLTAWLLVAIAAVSSLTGPLSNAGLRSLFPVMVPRPLWERANAVDSTGWVAASIVGPPLAGVLVQIWGGPAALLAIGCVYAVAAVVLIRIPSPRTPTASTGRLLLDAWQGLVYTWRNRTLRGLAISISTLNLSGGVVAIVVPILILGRLHGNEATVGLMYAISGLFGMVAAISFGRTNTRGRERAMLVLPMIGTAGAFALLLPAAGLLLVAASMAISGFLNGPMDIAMFTLRQRRTDPAWMGRAFAVSMSFNFIGYPIGSALTGWLASASVDAAILFGIGAALAAAIITRFAVPREEAGGGELRVRAETAAHLGV